MTEIMEGRRRFTVVVLTGAALLTLAMLIHAAQPWQENSKLGWAVLAFAVWPLSPYGALVFMAYGLTTTEARSGVVFVASIVISLLGVVSLVYAFFIHLHSTSGLVFFALPVLQLIGCVVTWMILTGMQKPEQG